MAQGTMAPAVAGPNGNVSSMPPLTTDELHEVQQYKKLLQFRDEVVAGSHPRIKPTHLLGKPASALAAAPSQTGAAKMSMNGNRRAKDNSQSFQANLQRSSNLSTNLPGLGALSGPPSGPSKQLAPGKPEINPVLLEKSEDLIKAEMQLHRQRLERALKDQIEQRRASHKASVQASEQLAEFDVADVMARAMALVETNTAQPTDDTAANAEASSDSFDDNTFYSSHHDTPSSQMASRLPNESDDEEMRDGSPYEPELDIEPVAAAVPLEPANAPTEPHQNLLQSALFQHNLGSSTPSSTAALSQSARVIVPGLSSEATASNHPYRHLLPAGAISSQESGTGSRSEDSGNTGKEHAADSRDLSSVNERLLGQVHQATGYRESPVVRSHDLSPAAPQPAHVSPLAVARQRPLVRSDTDTRRGTPAQVAALRKQHSAATSPDSSPQGSKAERKKNKKKKRKAERLAAEASAASPYIKPEPRSPSPLTAMPDSRPSKRQRQSNQQLSEFSYDESRYGQPISIDDNYQDRYPPRVQREERVVGYERIDESGRREVEPIIVDSPQYQRVYYDEPRSAASIRQGLPGSPHVYETQYAPRETRSVRPVSIIERPQDPALYYDARPASRASIRPATYRARSQSPIAYERNVQAMPPPRAAPARIIVDSFGREYIEPPRSATIIRDGAGPEYRVVGPDRIYERAPPHRAVSRRPELYDDDAVVYRPASPAYGIPRRVITQPEYAASEHRIYRDTPMAPPGAPGEYISSRPRLESRTPAGEYVARAPSARPPVEPLRYDGAPDYERRPVEERSHEYVDVRAASARPPPGVRYEVPVAYERRTGEEVLREYASARSASVRPTETIRYEMPRDYGTRVGSVRPEMPGREYAVPEGRREVMQPPPAGRGYSVMPGEQVIRREFNTGQGQPEARYYGGRPPVQGDDEVVFLNQQPREVYREAR
ncbi:hypothetical protein QBC34DRAFT_402177 [Podospora aff. communis PSN243]|uniref:Uncharacterized protein n=1 Tax=Podospora aff. communis PSN243 TaxID=3040156 RepID=A0AAV9GPC1_9PEZI|nr:hypothetical protein QBC34DRAFT_402177 [Podospora aff. communis PSN243]